jgi:hypothetical protein
MLEEIKAALYDYKATDQTRTMDAQFRGERITLQVLKLRPDSLFLNHNNSRIMVELEAHPEYDQVMANPTAPKSQLIIEALLRATPAYEQIREEVKQFKQREPGTLSVDGRVINGNTRLVALRELGWDGFDAGILPEQANDEDFKEIELGLQLVEFTKQRYSFVNRLRQFEIMLATKPIDEICKLMGWKQNKLKKFDEFKLMLEIVNEFDARGIPKVFFNTKEEYLKDLAGRIQTLNSQGKVAQATQLKGLRLLGMLAGNSKDEVRNIEGDFIEKHVLPRAESSPAALEIVTLGATEETPSDEFADLFPSPIDASKQIVDEAINIYKEAPDGDEFAALSDVFRLAGDDAVQANKRTSRNAMPQQMLTKVHSDINQVRAKLKELNDKGEISSVEATAFESALSKAKQALDVLEQDFQAFVD